MLKKILIIITAITITPLIYFMSVTYSPEDPKQMALVDRVILNELDELFSLSPQEIWNSEYILKDKPIILVRKEKWKIYNTIFIINKPKSYNSAWLKKVDSSLYQNINNLYSTRWYNLSVMFWSLISDFTSVKIEEDNALVFYYSEDDFPVNGPNRLKHLQFLSHEAFHLYHQEGWNYDENGSEFISHYPHNHEHYQLLAREMVLLDHALDNLSDHAVLQNALRDWVTIREERYKQWPQLIAETNSETMEGTATYVELKPFLLNYDEMFVPAGVDAALSFEDNLNWIISSNNHHFLERRMSYEKGLALCLILDKLSEGWKQSLGTNAPTLYQLIKASVFTSEHVYQASGTNK